MSRLTHSVVMLTWGIWLTESPILEANFECCVSLLKQPFGRVFASLVCGVVEKRGTGDARGAGGISLGTDHWNYCFVLQSCVEVENIYVVKFSERSLFPKITSS